MIESTLEAFTAAVQAHDSPGLASLFTADGIYDDYFFGRHTGRDEIAAMLDRFHVGGEAFCWQFHEIVEKAGLAYASYLFSYRSREPESQGKIIVFEGMARLRMADGLIAHYAEAFDRALAFSQLGYPSERIGKLMARYARGFVGSQKVAAHLAYRQALMGETSG